MRKSLQLALVAALVLLGGTTAYLYTQFQKKSQDFVAMKDSQQQSENRYESTINAIAEIQDSLNAISLGENGIQMQSKELASEQRLSGPNGQQALDRIAQLRESISRSKQRIRQLESSLHSSGMKVKGLEKMIAGLKQGVEEKTQQVAQLQTQVESLTTQVAGLQTEVAQTQDTVRQRDESLEQRRRELATIYYVVGNKKQLTQSGVLVAKGGVLGVGKTLTPSDHIQDGTFQSIDTDQQTTVTIAAAKARVLTPQPASSYEMRLVGGQVELHILNPNEFRKVRQLVILTA